MKPISQIKNQRLTELCNFSKLTWLVSDRAGTGDLV